MRKVRKIIPNFSHLILKVCKNKHDNSNEIKLFPEGKTLVIITIKNLVQRTGMSMQISFHAIVPGKGLNPKKARYEKHWPEETEVSSIQKIWREMEMVTLILNKQGFRAGQHEFKDETDSLNPKKVKQIMYIY